MTSINGFSVEPYGSTKIKTFVVPGTAVKLNLRAEVAPLLVGLAADFNQHVEVLQADQCGGHAYRKIAGSDSWSFHALGVAEDFNWNRHPMGVRATFTSRQIMEIRKLLEKWSYAGKPLFRWGGDYRSRPDDMHFELIQSRDNCLAAVKLLQTPRPTQNWTDKIVNAMPVIKKGDNGPHVKTAQALLTARGFWPRGGIDGDFGDDTDHQTRQMQTHLGAEIVDGVWGPETWTIGLTGRDQV